VGAVDIGHFLINSPVLYPDFQLVNLFLDIKLQELAGILYRRLDFVLLPCEVVL
jgi:hypothetical protein